MPEITRLSEGSDWIDVDFVERERTPRSAMKLGIQLHVTGLSLSHAISILDELGVQCSRNAVHDWVQKADPQPGGGASPNRVAVDESVIRINDQQYWLYAAVDPATNQFLHIRLFSTYLTALTEIFHRELRESTTTTTPCFSSMTLIGCKLPSNDTAKISAMSATEIATASNVYFER